MKTIKVLLLFIAAVTVAVSARAGDGRIRQMSYRVPDEYIVVFAESVKSHEVPDMARELARQYGGQVLGSWNSLINVCAVKMPEARAQAMSHDPRIAWVEENATWSVSGTRSTRVDPENDASQSYNRMWHLDRIDQSSAALDGSYTQNATGVNVDIYIVDMGVWKDHQEFKDANGNTRVTAGYDASGEGTASDPCANYIRFSNFGHGTAVASLAAGKKVGLAPDARIIPVKVGACVGGSFTTQMIIDGLNWIGTPYDSATGTGNPFCYFHRYSRSIRFLHPTVINMSFGGVYGGADATSVEWQLDRLGNIGAVLFASANNQGDDACNTIPARHSRNSTVSPGKVITIGGTMISNPTEILGLPIPGAPGPTWGPQQDAFWTIDPYTTSDSSPHSLGCKPTAATPNDYVPWIEGSNYGPCVSFLAPAKNIAAAFFDNPSPWDNYARSASYRDRIQYHSNTAKYGPGACQQVPNDPRTNYGFASGTSYASPIGAGIAAQYLQNNPAATPDQVHDAILLNTISNVVQNVPAGTPNRLLHQFQ